jgi:uncharacterized repeat protein (TIGR03803 family)
MEKIGGGVGARGIWARWRGPFAVLAVAIAVWALSSSRAEAYTFKPLHSFCTKADCLDGERPNAGLILDASGRLYGTTYYGGDHCKVSGIPTGCGVVFTLTLANNIWTETPLYNFCAKVNGDNFCADGVNPDFAGLIFSGGSLFGTTSSGGANNYGVVFELTPNNPTDPTKWTGSAPYSFCGLNACASVPDAGLIRSKTGILYGTTYQGGKYNAGTVFQLAYDTATKKWVETTLYSFCARGGQACTDGAGPEAPLLMDGSGNLYGTTYQGGTADYGTAFMLTPNNPTNPTKWTETVLHSFCVETNCADGYFITTALVMDKAGNLYGESALGGATDCQYSCGLVFELTPQNAARTKWKEVPVHVFCSRADCADGMSPAGNLTIDQATGTLYGATYYGGAHNSGGTVFSLAPNAKKGWTETVLHNFCADLVAGNCADGANPQAGVVMDKSGNLYGTTANGGAHCGNYGGCGTAYALLK